MEFSVCYQFAVQRRIPWDDDRDALRKHVNDVRGRIAEHLSVEDVRTTSDLSTAHLTVEFVIFGSNRQSVEIELRTIIGEAIRASGAYHKGLIPAADEIKLRPRVNTWSGLRTPTWRVRRSAVSLKRSLGVGSAAD
jgi:hypothetical protein